MKPSKHLRVCAQMSATDFRVFNNGPTTTVMQPSTAGGGSLLAVLRRGKKLQPYAFLDRSVCGQYRGPVVPRDQIERVTCPWCRKLIAMNDARVRDFPPDEEEVVIKRQKNKNSEGFLNIPKSLRTRNSK